MRAHPSLPEKRRSGPFVHFQRAVVNEWKPFQDIGAIGDDVVLVVVELPESRESTKRDRKSTRLNSSHLGISYAVFCLKKNKIKTNRPSRSRCRLRSRVCGIHGLAVAVHKAAADPRRPPPGVQRRRRSGLVRPTRCKSD